MNNDEIMSKLSPQDRELLAKEIGKEVEAALARAEAAKAAANDPDRIRQEALEHLYPSTSRKTEIDFSVNRKQIEAADAWARGERWESSLMYPSMDHASMLRSREGKKNE